MNNMTSRPKGKPYSFQKRLRIYWRDAFTCTYCGRALHPLSEDLTLDHIDPAGGDTDENLTTACRSCNARKGNKPIMQQITRESLLESLKANPIIVRRNRKDELDLVAVIAEVCIKWDVTHDELFSSGRASLWVRARADLAIRMRRAGYTYAEIAVVIGKKDHSTIVHLIRRYAHSPEVVDK